MANVESERMLPNSVEGLQSVMSRMNEVWRMMNVSLKSWYFEERWK